MGKKKNGENWLDWEKYSDFPGGPALQTWCFHYRGDPFQPWSGTWDLSYPLVLQKKQTDRKTVVSWSFLASFLFSFYYLRKYWSIVDLRCCVSSKWTVQWFSYTHIDPHLSDNPMLIGYWRILSRSPAAAEVGPWWLSSPYWLVRASWFQALNLSPHPPTLCLQNHFPFGTRSLFSICVNPSVLYISSFVSFLNLEITYDWCHKIFAILWLTSVSAIISGSSYVTGRGILSFFSWLSHISSYMCVCI